MAKRVSKPAPQGAGDARAPSAASKAADKLQVMRPDLDIPLAGEDITVKEYSFWVSMDIVYRDRAFLDDCIALLATDDRDPWEAIRGLFGKHAIYLKRAAAESVGREVAWVESLNPRDTDLLMSSWWAVNGHFFLHEATVVIRGRQTKARLNGTRSSMPLPSPDLEALKNSGSTPSVN